MLSRVYLVSEIGTAAFDWYIRCCNTRPKEIDIRDDIKSCCECMKNIILRVRNGIIKLYLAANF